MRYSFDTEIPCPYTTFKDLSDRLHATICKYKNEPVYVSLDGDANRIYLYSPDKKKKIEILHTDQANQLDVSSLEVGYLNHTHSQTGVNKVYYVKRLTDRQWKQGISNYNITYETIDGQKQGVDLLHQVGFEDMLKQRYPTFALAKQSIGRDGEIAISQEVALKSLPIGIILIYFRGKNIGWVAPNSDKIELEDSKTRWVVQRQLSAYGLQV